MDGFPVIRNVEAAEEETDEAMTMEELERMAGRMDDDEEETRDAAKGEEEEDEDDDEEEGDDDDVDSQQSTVED
mgnify:CR=1 FL=1